MGRSDDDVLEGRRGLPALAELLDTTGDEAGGGSSDVWVLQMVDGEDGKDTTDGCSDSRGPTGGLTLLADGRVV